MAIDISTLSPELQKNFRLIEQTSKQRTADLIKGVTQKFQETGLSARAVKDVTGPMVEAQELSMISPAMNLFEMDWRERVRKEAATTTFGRQKELGVIEEQFRRGREDRAAKREKEKWEEYKLLASELAENEAKFQQWGLAAGLVTTGILATAIKG